MQRLHSAPVLEQLAPVVVDEVDAPVDRDEVYRYLGYPAGVVPHRRLERDVSRWIDEAALRASPCATYLVLPVVEKDRRSLALAIDANATGKTSQRHGSPDSAGESMRDAVTFHGAIGEFLGAARSVAIFVATAGPGVEKLASELMRSHDQLAAMVVNAVGAERAEAAETVVIDRLREDLRPIGFAPTLPYSPGYCGMALTEQKKLFSLFPGDSIGVVLSDACLMCPLKSVSGLIGLGPADEVAAKGSPCDRCELYTCAMRR